MPVLSRPIKIIGKEYQRKLLPLEVYAHAIEKSWIDINSKKIEKIWADRCCFVCRGKFKHGTTIMIALTDKGNKLICENCKEDVNQALHFTQDKKISD